MNLQGIKSGFAFSRNPIVVRDTWPPDFYDKNGGCFQLSINGENVYEGRFFPPLDIDLSDILDAYATPLPEPSENNDEPFFQIEDLGELACRGVRCNFEYDGAASECEFTVIPGGVSKQNYRIFQRSGRDAFMARFFNPRCNFFMTTRTADWRISMKETELFPLYFFINAHDEKIETVDPLTGEKLIFDSLDAGIWALDVDALRLRFMNEMDVIPNVFDIFRGGAFSCRIIVERSDSSKERYRIKFRNSLGVFEIIEMTGAMQINSDFTDEEDSLFKRYDPTTGGFFADRERTEIFRTISLGSGVKRSGELGFMMDMIGSDEVYLLDMAHDPVKVIPDIEEFKHEPRPETPEAVTITLTVADSEINIMPEIASAENFEKQRVFSRQFTKQFN